ncbi:tubulin-specific chaperone E [Coccinella septempunctata]|uniref:tubulin-specific chaperone E n=1 Tax=Coccinella septempunctata TaxID=41139 RepID=UPI001D05C3EA|nr:tubulin-specific chaperone E [Coccinella septempunctata]
MTMIESENNIMQVGSRIDCSGHIGTIKYMGCLEGYSSTWLGIDWDDPKRGKHNGHHNGKQYFEASFQTSGTFVRPEKVELGQSIISSIMKRYGKKDNVSIAQDFQQELLYFQQCINAPFLEMVGFEKVLDKQSNFDSLQVVDLRKQKISSAGKNNQLKDLCPNIKELDLSLNLISSWEIVFQICKQLDQLCWLNVSENLLTIPANIEDFNLPTVETLICTKMRLTWEDILKVTLAFPNITELRVPFNNIKNLDTPSEILKNLKVLDIEDNEIGEWSEICKLSTLENLEELFVGNVGLKKIEFIGHKPKVDTFLKLKKLAISNNLIDNWDSVSQLNRMKNLEELRFIKNPVLEQESEASRFEIIVARIGNLKVLNGTDLKPYMRREAEYDYMKIYGLEWLRVCNTPEREQFIRSHNRFLELIDMYGEPDEGELVTKPQSISNTLIELRFEHEGKVVTKKLPKTIVVQKLVMLAQKFFKLSYRPNLIHIRGEASNLQINLEEQREIGFYSMQDGDRILISHE